jgi:ABC-type multidrug transport system fused ATPase/permease subunit
MSHYFSILGGKTTCISLLEHFYEADEGQILIDGIPVQNYEYKYYHQKVNFCFSKSIFIFSIQYSKT